MDKIYYLNGFVFPYRIYCSMIVSNEEDIMIFEEADDNIYVNIRHTKDFHYVTVNMFSTKYSKVSVFTLYLINSWLHIYNNCC